MIVQDLYLCSILNLCQLIFLQVFYLLSTPESSPKPSLHCVVVSPGQGPTYIPGTDSPSPKHLLNIAELKFPNDFTYFLSLRFYSP